MAIESVCHDFLRTEYNGPTIAESRPNWDGVDDYLHQAADSTLWPDGMVYDPDNDGILIKSLGVHEHWNNFTTKKYTRNLGIGDGIELIKVHEIIGLTDKQDQKVYIEVYPNPVKDILRIRLPQIPEDVDVQMKSVNGTMVYRKTYRNVNSIIEIDASSFSTGVYMVIIQNDKFCISRKFIKI